MPALVSAIYVRPNEISIERPYIQTHIQATRSAFGLDRRIKETEFAAKLEARFDPARNQALLENVRLWDWRAFHDTVTQIQALRPYYIFADTDVDRYIIDGQLRQVLLTPRELDIRQLPDAQTRWINPHFIYTHGYGLVMAEANRITADGLPVLFIQDAPPVVKTQSLKLTRPEIYYGEVTHEPVFVHTEQPEFNYPSGADNVFARYEGKGGFPVSSLAMRIAAAVARGRPQHPAHRLSHPAKPHDDPPQRPRPPAHAGPPSSPGTPIPTWCSPRRAAWSGWWTDTPPRRRIPIPAASSWRASETSTTCATPSRPPWTPTTARRGSTSSIPRTPSSGPTSISSPACCGPSPRCPPDLRAHARYPEIFFRVQAEVYRTYHMRDPQAFYNKEDLWDIARTIQGQGGHPEPVAPAYVVASLPGEDQAEFLLIVPFTPRNKDNMIGLMVARCDGEHLGELVVLQLSKQELIFGPMQIEARINQDQTISKDLTLWNQQGSQVLRGQMLVLPVANTFLYVEPLYIQAAEARMPQLKKIALAIGNTLIYRDTYEQALADLSNLMQGAVPEAAKPPTAAPAAGAAPGAAPDPRLESVRTHLRRYRELASQGKWAEAGRELEAIEAEVQKR